jgi:hypothetical protein
MTPLSAVLGLLGHPPAQEIGLPLSPLGVMGVTVTSVLLLLAGGLLLPDRRRPSQSGHATAGAIPAGGDQDAVDSWAGALSPLQVATRSVAIALFGLAIAAARVGSPLELRNIAPALVVGIAWPLLLLGSALIGPVWRWTDPWDGLGRVLEADEGGDSEGAGRSDRLGETVWPAVVPALAWGWYLSAYARPLDPRSLGAALAAYSLFTIAACIAFGRQRWLSRVEVFGLLFSWTARLPRGRLISWRPPRGTEAVLGVLAGGLLFGALRRTSFWGDLNFAPLASLYAAAGVVACSLLGAGILWGLSRVSDREGATGAVAAACIPALASIGVAIAMARYRLFTSAQLLVILASDPFGFGWDLFGTADWLIVPEPVGHLPLAIIQIAVLIAGHVIGAFVLSRRADRDARRPGVVALVVLITAGLLAVTGAP